MRRFVVAGAGLLAAAGIAIPTFADARSKSLKHASVNKGGWVVCREEAAIHINPPLKLRARHAAQFTVSDVLEHCTSSDPTIDRGIALVKNKTSSVSCMGGGRFTGVGRVRWNNGKVSRILDKVTIRPDVAIATGRISSGTEFVGAPFAALDKAVIDESVLNLCGSRSGIATMTASGEIEAGHISIDGVPFEP